jgi:Kef-type K+ transport system membrane component KefB
VALSWVGGAFLVVLLSALLPAEALASGSEETSQELIRILLGVALILFFAKLSGHVAETWHMPAVLGELLIGIVLGNLWLVGIDWLEFLKHEHALEILAELGIIFLLFQIGLESNMRELLAVGRSALLVAILGVIAPTLLGVGVSAWFLPDAHPVAHLFVGATLAATSVGITARVLEEGGFVDSVEGRIILGAAVIDDVLGLVILAMVTGAVAAISGGAALGTTDVLFILGKVAMFFAIAVVAGLYVSPHLFRLASGLRGRGLLLATAIVFCFALADIAVVIGLAPIVGAFAAGLALDETSYRDFAKKSNGAHRREDLIEPIATFLVPVFFVLMGLQVDLPSLLEPKILIFALVLSVAAFAGKQVCALGVLEKGANRTAVGLGMVPRGEVGLIFAGIGAGLMVGGKHVVSPSTYSVLVFMVIVTTLVTPPLLMRSLRRGHAAKSDAEG